MADGVMALLEDINAAGTTIVMVTHDADLAGRAPRNVQVLDGWVQETAEAIEPPVANRAPAELAVVGS
jgi:putative ABC transport system ATP-binding protein